MYSQCALIAGESQAKEPSSEDSQVEWSSATAIDLVHLVPMRCECSAHSTRHTTTSHSHHARFGPTPPTAHALLSLIILLLNLCFAHPRLKAYGNIGQIKMRYYKSKLDYQAYNALVGDSIALPCNITPPSSDDGVSLILWYRDDLSSPIYTVDSRLTFHLHVAKHFMDTSVLADRASFNITYPVSYLRFGHVAESDTAEYRCRVDFRRGRTINRVMQLNVIVPTKSISIYDSNHNSINDIAGPFNEDSSLNLTCESEGGHPPPVVRWWKGDVLLTGQKTSQHKSNSHSVITFERLQRENLMMPLTCESFNTNLTEPVTKTILIDLNLKPTEVRIIESLGNMTADQRVELVCQSSGSRPPASIFWKKNQKLLEHYSESTSDDGSVTTNFVTFTPSREDNGKLLICTAYNPQFSDYQLKATIKLNVHYAPILSLLLGASVQRQEIVEGNSVYFDCNIQANPQIHQFGWLLDGNELVERDNDQIEIRNNSIIIRNVNKDHIGAYQCYASNPLGKTVSEVVNLNVKYTPLCVGDEEVYYKVEPYTQLTIQCGVHAEPSNVSFVWQFNSSLLPDKSDLPQRHHHPELAIDNSGTNSVVRFVPHSAYDYGTLQCFAENRIGRQKRPCTFHIIKSELPDTPQNCSLSNITVTSLTVQCAASHQPLEADPPHRYVLQIFNDHNQLIRNVSANEVPRFQVTDLPAGFDLSLFVYAVNHNGASEKVRIVASTLVGEPRKLEHIEQKINIKPFILLILFTALLLLLTTLFLTLFLLKLRNKYKAKHRKKKNKITSSVFDTETSNITTAPVATANPNVSAYSLQMRSCSATGEASADSGEIITLGELAPPQPTSNNLGSPMVPMISHMPTRPELLAQSYLVTPGELMSNERHLSQCAPIINYNGGDHVAICSEVALPHDRELVYLAQMHTTTNIGDTSSTNAISPNEPFFANYIALDHAGIEKTCGLGTSDALGTACILLRDGLEVDSEVKPPTPPLPSVLLTTDQPAQFTARLEPKTPAKVRFSE